MTTLPTQEQVIKLSVSDLAQLILKLDPTIKRSEAYTLASRLKKGISSQES
jgi:hypothetical protein